MNSTLTLFDRNTFIFLGKSVVLSVFVLLLNYFNYFFHFVLPYSVELNFIFTFIFAGIVNFLPLKMPLNVKTTAVLAYFVVIYLVLPTEANHFDTFKLLHICLGLYLVGKDKSWIQNVVVLISVLLLNFLWLPSLS